MSNPIVLKALMEIFYFTQPEVSQIELYFALEKATFEIIIVSSLRIRWTSVNWQKCSNIKPQINLSVALYKSKTKNAQPASLGVDLDKTPGGYFGTNCVVNKSF